MSLLARYLYFKITHFYHCVGLVDCSDIEKAWESLLDKLETNSADQLVGLQRSLYRIKDVFQPTFSLKEGLVG